jgi:glycosyltransferase involved in cell wall biosynthesis
VQISSGLSASELAARYQAAHAFVCLSEHEGFCVPLLEAMHHDVPVIAFAAGAVRETIGNGGLVLDRKDPETVAAAVERLLSDADLRARFVAAGAARAAALDPEKAKAAFVDAVEGAGAR